MRAALVRELDGAGAITVEDLTDPKAEPGSVIVRVRAAALNFFDTLMLRGKYQEKPPLPFSPGGEIAGVIETLGDGVTGFQAGQRVMALVGWNGCRERIAVPAASLVPVPDAVADEAAAGVAITYGTALHAFRDRGRLVAGETVAISGAAGGAGLAAVEIAKLMGARVTAVVSSEEKLATAREHGADDGTTLTGDELKRALMAMSDGKGFDVVYDCVGGALTEPMLRALAWCGRFLVIGFAGGEISRPPLNLVMLKSVDLSGVNFGGFRKREPERSREQIRQLLDWCAEGRLRPRIDSIHRLDDIAAALGRIESRAAQGKVIVRP